jgi:regulator of sigma E protease
MTIESIIGFLTTALTFVLVLGVLVTVHEFGHFFAARLTGTRAEVFAVGMGNRVVGYNGITGLTFGGLPEAQEERVVESGMTDYRLSMLPIGGYVKISGMIDESMDADFVSTEPKPWEFRSKNAAQKIFIMSAGVIMNILLAIAIFTGIAMFEGKSVLDTTTIAYVEKGTVAEAAGLQSGDRVVAVNGEKPDSWMAMTGLLTKELGEDRTLTIELADAVTLQQPIGILPKGASVLISGAESLKPAGKAGLLAGDTIVSANAVRMYSVGQFAQLVRSSTAKPIALEWKRGGSLMSAQVTPDNNGRIGVALAGVLSGGLRKQHYGFFESFGVGLREMTTTVTMYIGSLAQLFKGKVSVQQSVGGPIQIAKMSKQSADLGFSSLLRFMALLSVILAVMNILPFPALDGGHIMFILVETVIRREIPVKIKMGIQQAGIFILLCFMVFVFYNDLTR